MDPKSAKERIEQLCRKLDRAPERQGLLARARRAIRPLGLGLAMGLALGGCGDDSGKPGTDGAPPDAPVSYPDTAYGVPDGFYAPDMGVDSSPQDAGPETITGPDAAYGVPDGQ